jgi:hypothetical protein
MKTYKLTFCIAFLLLAAQFASAQKNLVLNGGFEDEFFGWNADNAMRTPYSFKSGKYSCAIVTTNTDNWIGIDQTVRIPKKAKDIEFDAWIKTTNVVKGKNDWDGAVFTIVFLDGSDKEMGEGVNIARITGTNDWALCKKIIKMPDKAYSFKILLAMGNASGTMQVDDVAATVVD